MPIINGVKYACEPCMRGHRSSKCTHEDRLLVQVRKPGRPLSSCPHLPTGGGGTTTFVDANGARLDDTTPTHGHEAGEKPCGCGVTSLAIPKVATCACSIPQFSSSTTKPTSKSSSFELRIYPHQHFKARVSSPPTSPVSPAPVYGSTSESNGRISKITKKRKSISVSGEAILQVAGREALFKIAGQQDAIENRTITKRIAEPLAEVGYSGEDIHPTGGQLSNGHACMPTGQESDIRQSQNKEASTHHDSSNTIFNSTAFWGQDNWRSGTEAPIPHQPPAKPATLQQPKPCCNSYEPKPAQSTAHNHLLMNQAQFQAPLRCGLPPGPSFYPMFHETIQHMQPIATTIYTYPNGYTTVNNPLTLQELRMLQATGAWTSGAAAAWSGLGVGSTGNGMNAEYACSCGPACECLGCAAHPFNTSTVNFVKDMRTMMYSGRHGVPPRRTKVATDVSSPTYTSSSSPDPTNGGDDTETEQNTVSPSAYFHIDYPLGLCSESDMGCLCGDDCACIGCMLHENNMPDIGTTPNEPIESEVSSAQNLTSGRVDAALRGCCGGGGRININSETGIETGPVGGPQGRGISNGVTNHNPQHQSTNEQVSANIHQKPQIHPLLEGIRVQEIVDGQPVLIPG
ncbi:hypothetical protein EV426DRAFT_216349 [Tirmania nivea]|nr:hypothetical protein EV426DRAFT_216349 [Tirmania nivea]